MMSQRWPGWLLLGGGLLFLLAAVFYHAADGARDVPLLLSARVVMLGLGSLLFVGTGTFLVGRGR